jgi:hypothetical protein
VLKTVRRARGFMPRVLPMGHAAFSVPPKRLRSVIAARCFRSGLKVLDNQDETVVRADAA